MEAQFEPPEGEMIIARAEGTTFMFEHRLDYDRATFEAGGVVFEDGSTIQDFEDDLRASACHVLHHRDFLELGGTVIHHYVYSDGESQGRIVIDQCADDED